MPFRWKKKKSRFSQLVADHLQSPKRGGSLVVQTGFPTSLIDLYVRNRGRFRKSSEREHRCDDSSISLSYSSSLDSSMDSSNLMSVDLDHNGSHEIIEEDVIDDVSIDFDVDVNGVVGSVSRVEERSLQTLNSCKMDEEEIIEIVNSSKIDAEEGLEIANSNRAFMAALKVFAVVVLALATKRFTVGITVSAFFLFFLELVGRPLFGRLSFVRPGCDPKSLFPSSFHRTKNIKSSNEKISHVVPKVEEIHSKEEIMVEKELDEFKREALMELKHKGSRRGKMKLKMKNLVTKKLRSSKPPSPPLVFSNECLDSKGEIFHGSKQEQDNVVEEERQSLSLTLASEINCNDTEFAREAQEDLEYLVMCLIVLVGLIGGRILALILALSWCLMLKNTERRNVKWLTS